MTLFWSLCLGDATKRSSMAFVLMMPGIDVDSFNTMERLRNACSRNFGYGVFSGGGNFAVISNPFICVMIDFPTRKSLGELKRFPEKLSCKFGGLCTSHFQWRPCPPSPFLADPRTLAFFQKQRQISGAEDKRVNQMHRGWSQNKEANALPLDQSGKQYW